MRKGRTKQNKTKWKALNSYKSSKWLALIFWITHKQKAPPAKKNSTIRAPPACLTVETRHVETTYLNSSTTVKQLEWHFPSGCCPVKLQYLHSGSTTNINTEWLLVFAPCLCRFPQSCDGEWPGVCWWHHRSFDREGEWWGAASGDLASSHSTRTRAKRSSWGWTWPWSEGQRQAEKCTVLLETQVRMVRNPSQVTTWWYCQRIVENLVKNAGISLGNHTMLVQHVPLYV